MAMLALAPDSKRARSWLQDKLWSTRRPSRAPPAFGKASMKRAWPWAMTGPARVRTSSTSRSTGQDALSTWTTAARSPQGRMPNFWKASILATMSSRTGCENSGRDFASEVEQHAATVDRRVHDVMLRRRQRTARTSTRFWFSPASACRPFGSLDHRRQPARRRCQVGRRAWRGQGLRPACRFRAATERTPTSSGRAMPSRCATRVFDTEAKKIVRLAMLQIPENSLAWSSTLQLSSEEVKDVHDPARAGLHQSRGQCCSRPVLEELTRAQPEPVARVGTVPLRHHASVQAWARRNFEAADKLFARAFEIERRGDLSGLARIPEDIPPRRTAIHEPRDDRATKRIDFTFTARSRWSRTTLMSRR